MSTSPDLRWLQHASETDNAAKSLFDLVLSRPNLPFKHSEAHERSVLNPALCLFRLSVSKMETISDACQRSLSVCATSSVCFPHIMSRKVSKIPSGTKRCMLFPIAAYFNQLYSNEGQNSKGSSLNGPGQNRIWGLWGRIRSDVNRGQGYQSHCWSNCLEKLLVFLSSVGVAKDTGANRVKEVARLVTSVQTGGSLSKYAFTGVFVVLCAPQ